MQVRRTAGRDSKDWTLVCSRGGGGGMCGLCSSSENTSAHSKEVHGGAHCFAAAAYPGNPALMYTRTHRRRRRRRRWSCTQASIVTRPVSCSNRGTTEPESQGSRTRTVFDAGGPKGEAALHSIAARLDGRYPTKALEPVALRCRCTSRRCCLGD